MKLIQSAIALSLLIGLTLFTACDKGHDLPAGHEAYACPELDVSAVPIEVIESFEVHYPDCEVGQWYNKDNKLYAACFENASNDDMVMTLAYFQTNGYLQMVSVDENEDGMFEFIDLSDYEDEFECAKFDDDELNEKATECVGWLVEDLEIELDHMDEWVEQLEEELAACDPSNPHAAEIQEVLHALNTEITEIDEALEEAEFLHIQLVAGTYDGDLCEIVSDCWFEDFEDEDDDCCCCCHEDKEWDDEWHWDDDKGHTTPAGPFMIDAGGCIVMGD